MSLSFHGLKVYELKMSLIFHGKWWFQVRPTSTWRERQGILPTNTPLFAMKIGSHTECKVCFNDRVHCPFAIQVWSATSIYVQKDFDNVNHFEVLMDFKL